MGKLSPAALLACTLLFLAQGFVAAHGKEKTQPVSEKAASKEAVLHMRGVYMEEFGEKGLSLELWAESARYSRLEQTVEFAKVRVVAPPKEGGRGRRVELTGDSGQADLERKLVHIQGDVRIVTEDGYHLYTDQAVYNYELREIEGPQEVLMEGPEGTTDAVGLHVWLDEEVVLLRERVRTVLRPEAIEKAKEKMRP